MRSNGGGALCCSRLKLLYISLGAMILGVGQREACGSLDMRCVVRDSEQHQRV